MSLEKRTEPTAMIVSMALTALAGGYIDSTPSTWQKMVASIIFVLAGTSTTQLYWSLIIPLLREQLDGTLTRRVNRNCRFLRQLVSFYFQVNMRFLLARCTLKELRLLGYLNGLAAFLLFFLVQLIHIAKLGVWKWKLWL